MSFEGAEDYDLQLPTEENKNLDGFLFMMIAFVAVAQIVLLMNLMQIFVYKIHKVYR